MNKNNGITSSDVRINKAWIRDIPMTSGLRMSCIRIIGKSTAAILRIMGGLLIVTATMIFSLSFAIMTLVLVVLVIAVEEKVLLSPTLRLMTRRSPRPIRIIRIKFCRPVPTGRFTVPRSPFQGPLLGWWFPATLCMVVPVPSALIMAALTRYYRGRRYICIPPSLLFRVKAAVEVPLFSRTVYGWIP